MFDKVLSEFKQTDEPETISFDKKVKVGIIGCGGVSDGHLSSYLEMPDVEIVAAADLIPGKAEASMKDLGVKNVRFYPSDKELIDNEPDLDIVSICTYNTPHAGPAIYALEHGVNVILEKPFTVTLEETVEVMKAEKKAEKFCPLASSLVTTEVCRWYATSS